MKALLTLLTIEKNQGLASMKPSRMGIYAQVWE
jgi:hypothetical protein